MNLPSREEVNKILCERECVMRKTPLRIVAEAYAEGKLVKVMEREKLIEILRDNFSPEEGDDWEYRDSHYEKVADAIIEAQKKGEL